MDKMVSDDFFVDSLEVAVNDSILVRANALGLNLSSVHEWNFKDYFPQSDKDWKFFSYHLFPSKDLLNEGFYNRIIDSTKNSLSDVSLNDFEQFRDYSNDVLSSAKFENESGFKFIEDYSRESEIFRGDINSLKIAKSVYKLNDDNILNRGFVFSLFPDEYTAKRYAHSFGIRPKRTTGKLRFDSEQNSSTPSFILTSSRDKIAIFAKSSGISFDSYYNKKNNRVSLFPEYRS